VSIESNRPSFLRRALNLLLAVLLFLVNAYICRGLFAAEYLRHMGSIEAAYIGISRYMLAHWRDLRAALAFLPAFDSINACPSSRCSSDAV
jgi:hypothetical protein